MLNRRAPGRRWLALLLGMACAAALTVAVVPAWADSGSDTDSESAELLARFGEFDAARTAPTGLVASPPGLPFKD